MMIRLGPGLRPGVEPKAATFRRGLAPGSTQCPLVVPGDRCLGHWAASS